jgi:hypothetical protein
MNTHRWPPRAIWVLPAFFIVTALATEPTNLLRWSEGANGCTFSADADGKYRYGVWTDDFGVVLAVDADEVRKADRRITPLIAVSLSMRFRAKNSLTVEPRAITLEFVNHYHQIQPAIDPDELAARLQNEEDAYKSHLQAEISRHPERKDQGKRSLEAHEKDVADTQNFVRRDGLHPAQLDSANPEVRGWIFFNARSKWIREWKKQEQFVLRVPIAGRLVEFPFALPPSQGDLLLRQR